MMFLPTTTETFTHVAMENAVLTIQDRYFGRSTLALGQEIRKSLQATLDAHQAPRLDTQVHFPLDHLSPPPRSNRAGRRTTRRIPTAQERKAALQARYRAAADKRKP